MLFLVMSVLRYHLLFDHLDCKFTTKVTLFCYTYNNYYSCYESESGLLIQFVFSHTEYNLTNLYTILLYSMSMFIRHKYFPINHPDFALAPTRGPFRTSPITPQLIAVFPMEPVSV